jgi:hypothetical protein
MSKKIWLVSIASVGCFVITIFIFLDARQISGMQLEKISGDEYKVSLRDEQYILKYVPKQNIFPFFGRALTEFGNKFALVRNDLPKDVQKFVRCHEIYHLQDHKYKIVYFREIHATLGAIPCSPVGFMKTVFLTLTSPERLKHYF